MTLNSFVIKSISLLKSFFLLILIVFFIILSQPKTSYSFLKLTSGIILYASFLVLIFKGISFSENKFSGFSSITRLELVIWPGLLF
jgi:lipopolysaccharide export LptBFGC system permease protein LptF